MKGKAMTKLYSTKKGGKRNVKAVHAEGITGYGSSGCGDRFNFTVHLENEGRFYTLQFSPEDVAMLKKVLERVPSPKE